jgi:hypothetical protein
MHKIDLVLAAGVFLLSYCSTQPSGEQGIRGTVVLGPNCPVMQEGVPCPDTPFQTDLVITTEDDSRAITEFSSDAYGEFLVFLEPGTYGIRRPGEESFPFCSTDDAVTVEPGVIVEVTVFCDTGIR